MFQLSLQQMGFKKRWLVQDGRCFWCRKPLKTHFPKDKHSESHHNTATKDHLKASYEREKTSKGNPRSGPYVIACFRCNHLRAKLQHRNQNNPELNVVFFWPDYPRYEIFG